jgi:GT2 family glycosyltransferase
VRLSAIVPATNSPETLESCLEAIRGAEEAPDEVLVVDRAEGPGPAAARNAGAARASGDVLVFVDADVVPHRDAFRRIRAAFTAEPGLVALFGSYDDSPAANGVVSGFRNLLHHYVHQREPGSAETFWAGLGAIRREQFLAADGFDAARYPRPSVEDIDLGLRLTAGGADVRLDPELQGTHLKGWTLAEMVRTDLLDRGVPWLTLYLERNGGSTALNLGWRHRLSTAACTAGAVSLLSGRRRAATAAAVVFVGLNARFYALLLRRRGPVEATIGIGLHAIHHLTAAAAVPLAVGRHLGRRH